MKKIALFGGSFNPIHNAHMEIVNSLMDKKIVDEVWLIPCGNHAFDKILASGEDRIKMIKLSILNKNNLKINDIELLSDKKSFASNTIRKLKSKFKENTFYFIIGADNLKILNKWHDFHYLKENVKFILAKRPGFNHSDDLDIDISYILDVQNEISSTSVRNLIRNNQKISEFVPKEVEKYIIERRLYKI